MAFTKSLAWLSLLGAASACSDAPASSGTVQCACLPPADASMDPDGGPTPAMDAGPDCGSAVRLVHSWSSETFQGCLLASLLPGGDPAAPRVIASSGDGRVSALDPSSGALLWNVELPETEGEIAYVVATPVTVGDRLVLTWQDIAITGTDPATAPRSAHRVAVIDLSAGRLDPDYPILTLSGQRPSFDGSESVVFEANNALSRSRLVHLPAADGGPGFVYLSFGNARDIQPWHGWLFEIDLQAWKQRGTAAAISSLLLTSPETHCEPDGESGSREMNCGAGIWAPAGPELISSPSGEHHLLVPTGNGALDMNRHDYAHTIMRVALPGLSFDDGCDPSACASWDALSPSSACMESCRDLFIPRLLPGDPPLDQPNCEGLSFFACYAAHDLDLGANAPAVVELPGGPRALLLPAKDGHLYLFDHDHMGTLYDRLELVAGCGTDGARCTADWAGSMVTRPEITSVAGQPFAVVGSFEFDDVHPAGLFGVRIVMRDGRPKLEKAWQTPAPEDAAARSSFRAHASRVRLVQFAGTEYALVVDQKDAEKRGHLWLVRVSDGALAAKVALEGPGQRFAQPLLIDDQVFVASCVDGNKGPGHVEAFALDDGCE
ncbi:MAG: hypothetical protein QM778_03465 [Myxococcales bacterium]